MRFAPRRRKFINRIIENDLMRRVSFEEYRDKVRDVYDGPQGAMLADLQHDCRCTRRWASDSFRGGKFDLGGLQRTSSMSAAAPDRSPSILIKYADPRKPNITCTDLSHEMLRRARNRLKSDRPQYIIRGPHEPAVSGRDLRLRHLRLCAGAPPRREDRPGRNEPRDDARRADAAVGDRGHFFRAPGRAFSGDAAPTIAANWRGLAKRSA